MRVVTGRTRHPCDDDYDGLLLWPEPPGFSPVWHAHQRTYDRHGNDPVVGRRLVQLPHQAGLVPRRNTFVFGGRAGDRDFEDLVRNMASIVDEAIDDIIATGLSRDAVTAARDAFIEWSKSPDSAVWRAAERHWPAGVAMRFDTSSEGLQISGQIVGLWQAESISLPCSLLKSISSTRGLCFQL